MALKNNSGGGNYVRFKEGKFYLGKDKETGYNELEGTITSFGFVDDEYEGMPMRKLVIKLTDGDDNFILSLLFDSVYVSQLISFLKNANLSEPISLVGMLKEGDDGKKRPSILVKQDGTFLKGFYTKDNPNGMPKMKQVVVNKKKVWDKTEMQEFLENVVNTEFTPAVKGNKPAIVDYKAPLEKETVPEMADATDDLPF